MDRTGFKIGLDVGDAVASAARLKSAISAVKDELNKAKKEGRAGDQGRLSYELERLKGQSGTFDRDIKTLSKFNLSGSQTGGGPSIKIDGEYKNLLKEQVKSANKLASAYEEAIKSGNLDKAQSITPQLAGTVDNFHKTVQSAASAGSESRETREGVKALSLDKVLNAVTSGVSRYVDSLDRSGVVSKLGSGDIMGAKIEEDRRQANLWGGAAQSVLSIAGTAIGGPAGGVIGGAVGSLIHSALNIDPNLAATNEAYAKKWEGQAPEAITLNAMLGRGGGTIEENTNKMREVFDVAANSAARFGYSAEEGMEMMKQAAEQGLGTADAASSAQSVFAYERGTGANRGTLAALDASMRRYGQSDALGTGLAGTRASGMNTGQYGEYLRAMKQIFEDGISKGFVRGSKEIVGGLTLMSQISGGNEMWKGEAGAQRLSEMNGGLQAATALASSSDVMAFRGASIMAEKMTDAQWGKFANVDGKGGADIKRSGDYIDAMLVLERGLGKTPEMFKQQMEIIKTAEGGSRAGGIERMRQMYGLNYTNAAVIYDKYQETGGDITQDTLDNLIKKYGTGAPDNTTAEVKMFSDVADIQNMISKIGQYYTDKKGSAILEEKSKITAEHGKLTTKTFANTLFTIGEKDDDAALTRLGRHNPATYRQAMSIMNQFPDDVKKDLNESNRINRAIPDVMSDNTGKQLITALLNLAESMNVKIVVDDAVPAGR